ncbi:transmembrane protein KIAA1109 isoform X2 [Anthonomus grandis grandis]|uniref:transmembrane protein KIAA1109 isoform X2 n=1 Tax=Anthonomus grandis grandis TaxID=2921223 RepID=UPI002165D814|nr:transmembrane protein KIAA1109 isoform X2 [Anthonomus grandis grandis]
MTTEIVETTTMTYVVEKTMASKWNSSLHDVSLEDLKMDSNFLYLLFSLIFAVMWVVYITFYNSRILGYVITKVANKFMKEGYFKIGSLSVNALSGKIMLRDFVYITHDYTVRIQDGYLIFRWWRSYVPRDVSEDLSHSDTRLSVMLNGFELHVYNRSQLYSNLEKTFGLGSNIFPNNKDNHTVDGDEKNDNEVQAQSKKKTKKQRPEAAMARTWRDLIPVIKCDVISSRIVFGNRLVPTTLSITFEESHFVYSTKPAVCMLDRFMHFVKCKAENVRVMLSPSLKYTGMLDEPPRYMGEGFVLMSTNDLELYFYMDEAGIVPEEPVLITLANGDIVESSPPQWGVDIKCGKGTNFSYGPWADRQREHLYKFFYPQDFIPMEPTPPPKPGEKRVMHSFDVRLVMQNDSIIDILFTKDKETNAVHINVGAGSYLEVTIPWITKETGFSTKINGQLLHLEATTSLQFRELVESETLEFCILCHYPLVWNEHQLWEVNLTGCKATVGIIFYHKWFFTDLINDWASKARPDIMHFVPYTWRFGLTLKHCELLTLINQYNWIDCSSAGQRNRLENTQVALCAHFLHMSFDLPFDEFLPETVPINLAIQGESIDLSLFIPEFHTSRNITQSLEKYAKVLSKDGSVTKKTEIIPKWRNVCQSSAGWVDFWWIPIGAINISYVYHPCPPLGPQPQADISTPMKEEILLSPMRFPHHRKKRKRSLERSQKFDPNTLKPDSVSVELEIGPSVVLLYGTALKNFMNFKENIFGEYQSFTDMQQGQATESASSTDLKSEDSSANIPLQLRDDFDHRNYRPLDVDVSIVAHDVQGHLLKACNEKDPPCPVILVERFGFEMKKRYDQTELQLLLSPAILLVSDNLVRPTKDQHLNQGKLVLSSLQIRGHAMFSDVGQSLDQDTVEYAWLVEMQLGKLSGKVTTPQVYSILASLETLLLLIVDDENELNSPAEDKLLSQPVVKKKEPSTQNVHVQHVQQAIQHLLQPKNSGTSLITKGSGLSSTQGKGDQKQRKRDSEDRTRNSVRISSVAQPSSEDPVNVSSTSNVTYSEHKLKYKLVRVAVDAIDFWLVESGAALQLWLSPVRLASCNLHGKQVNSGLSCVIYSMSLRQLVWHPHKYNHSKQNNMEQQDLWLEVGAINFGPLIIESAISGDNKDQNVYQTQQKFLRMHDEKLKKLWFLWPDLNKTTGKCGCTGGCTFFGSNKNGARFFKPSKKDLEDGLNIAAFRVNEPGRDPGYGQSILHENSLIFRTPPYIFGEITLQDTLKRSSFKNASNSKISTLEREKSVEKEGIQLSSPLSAIDRKSNRRFSSTSIKSSIVKEVPYSRLIDSSPSNLPTKLDSDSKLNSDKTKLNVAETSDLLPKNSVSDSKLAVDYFTHNNGDVKSDEVKTDISVIKREENGRKSNEVIVTPQFMSKSFNASESIHSLGGMITSEEKLLKEVQRTTSMSSENHSEAFFSADEDINLASRSSSLRNSILSSGDAFPKQESSSVPPQRKKFSSELSIVTDRNGISSYHRTIQAPGSAPETGKLRLSTHRSDHEIHTPEHRTVQGLVTPYRYPTNRSVSPRILTGNNTPTLDNQENAINDLLNDSSDDTVSNTSYVSAVGSQEDFTLVDLHMQVNRLIVDSPMLMSSYVTHLSQLKCQNWQYKEKEDPFSAPMFERNSEGKLVYVGSRFVPIMEPLSNGITSLKMVSRSDSGMNQNKTPTSPYVYVWDNDEVENDSGSFQEEELLSGQNDAGVRTIVIVKLKGDLDVMISPLLLESLQRFVDSLTPTVSNLHPLTVLNHLHTSCVGQVTSVNVLKTTENVAKLCQPAIAGTEATTVYEETIVKQLQTAIFLPKVNVTLLQVSIVEEIISFSALDNIKDLTCVSLFSVCFDNISVKFHSDHQAKEVLERFLRPSVVRTKNKGANIAKFLGLQTNTNSDVIQGEPVFIESCENQQSQLVICLNIGKAHAQLRRLRNESSILEDAVITAIPSYKSKVLFIPTKVKSMYRGVEYYLQPPIKENNVTQLDELGTDDKLGFIMFEGGLEGISLKVVKKSKFEQSEIAVNASLDASSVEAAKSSENIESVTNTPKTGTGEPNRISTSKETNTPKVEKKNIEEESRNNELEKDNGKDSGNVSSCVIELKVVWFNFAAPPRAPITRKIDYTRLDWNLLSTASPAINAWMNPSNRLAIRIVHMVRTMYKRSTATVACLMAEAMEGQHIHTLPKSRYGKLTPLGQTLHDDPSLQLCRILRKFYLECDASYIESNLKESEIPPLYTLRQGVIVLSRQWKNTLYTPLMSQNPVKTRFKPMNVTIAVPDIQEESGFTDGEQSGNEEADITDEHARLLHAGVILRPNAQHRNLVPCMPYKELSSVHPSPRAGFTENAIQTSQVAVVSGGVESVLASPSPPVPVRKRKKSIVPVQPPNSSRASVVLPLFTGAGNPFQNQKRLNEDNICYGTLREDRTVINMGSDPSDAYESSPDLPSSPTHRAIGHAHSSEDLYSWMAKQDAEKEGKSQEGIDQSKVNTLHTESSGEPGTLPRASLVPQDVPSQPIQESVRLLDANQIFQPFLSGLGVMPQQLRFTTMSDSGAGNDVTTLDALGSNLCLVGNLDTLRIDIVVSEHGKIEKKKGKNKGKRGLVIDVKVGDESPSFVCEKVGVELEVDRMTDMAVNDLMKTRNVLYISRGQLKNHTSTVINFTMGVRYIHQRVNMPLLRLLHQISNMYQNVKDTQNELREQQPPAEIKRPKTSASDHHDQKHHSSASDLLQDVPANLSKQLTLKISDGSYTSQNKPVISPSPSLRSRPQSFAQKLRSTGKNVKGYVNLSEGVGTPISLSTPSGSAIERITVSSDKSTGKCWKTIYYLLELYANMPDTKTIKHRFSVGANDISEHYKGNRKYDILSEMKSTEDIEKADGTPQMNQHRNVGTELYRESTHASVNSHTKLVVFGVARIHRTRLLATLSGLKLEAEITSLHSSLTVRKKSLPQMLECSLTGQVGRTMIVLLEGVAPNLQTVVKVTIGKSQALYSSVTKRQKDKNSGLLTIGAVNIDIPQHPVALHGMVTRGSKQLSSTLQELRVQRTSSRMSRGLQIDEDQQNSPNHPTKETPLTGGPIPCKTPTVEKSLLQPLVMQFSVILQSLSITAALLPSLQAQYKMDQVNSTGFTGSKAKFTIDLPHHSLSFTTKLPQGYTSDKTEANLPSEASIALPAVHVIAEYIPETTANGLRNPEGVVFRQGGYLNANADIGVFEHSLTTDLLNHLVFVQKVFMTEVNEVVQKVYGGERPVPIWLEDTEEPSTLNRLLFSLVIKIQRIQLTATTAGSSAVRLETGAVVLELSNRVQNVSGSNPSSTSARLFGKAQVDLNLSLGQIIRNAVFEEADIEYQHVAFFNTQIVLRNAFQDEIVEGEDKEVVLITLKRPLIYVQPVAVDKAILVWLNYKNAYDYWNEKRANLNRDVKEEKFQLGQITSQLGTPHLGTLFLQLTVEDMGICLPLNHLPMTWNVRSGYEDSRGAVVVTLENTSISACSSGSLVSKGKFSNLCLRFAEEFETSLDDWKPDMTDSSIMNLCVVSDGTYEVCSRTIAAKGIKENAKWLLNVQWQMEGVDIHLDTNVGKQLSALGHTLTMLTGAEDTAIPFDYDSDDNDATDGTRTSQESILPAFVFDPTLDNKIRSKLIEKEMNEQAKIITDLRSLGASHGTIELEMKRLQELETMVYKDFRRDMIQKLRRQSMRASSIKGKFGLGSKSNTFRSKSFVVPSPMPEDNGSPGSAKLDTNAGSFESSPRSGPSRSASLRVKTTDQGPRVTFSDTQTMSRQKSLPSASSEISLPETELNWVDQLDIDGEKVTLRKKLPASYEFGEGSLLMDNFNLDQVLTSSPVQTASANVSQTTGPQKCTEPNVDLELDVKVFINSGKCVLHTKDHKEEEIKMSRMRKDRSCSAAGLLEYSTNSSPDAVRKNKDKLTSQSSSSKLRSTPHNTLVDLTIFHIPGMDVKLQYQSKVIVEDTPSDDFDKVFASATSTNVPYSDSEQSRIDMAFKRQESQAEFKSHSLNSELKGSSSMHGITNPNYGHSPTASLENLQFGTYTPPANDTFRSYLNPNFANLPIKKQGFKKASLFAWMTLQSVPEETIISPHILEFLEQTLEPIPAKTLSTADTSLLSSDQDINYGNYVYASFPVDVVVYFHMQPSTFRFSCLPVSRVECMLQLPSLDIVFSSKRAEDELFSSEFGDGAPNTAATAVGGLSVTGCLSDFSVYIFHPYGGKKSALKEAQWSPLSDSERKDSLSINVEFVKFHLSRSRMLNFKQETLKGIKSSDQSRAVIRFSTIIDIGSASFKYDMRRLTEILAFPKAWYRRSIVRRMFLGDLSMSATYSEEDEVISHKTSPGSSNKYEKSTPLLGNSKNRHDEHVSQKHNKMREIGRAFSGDSSGETPSPSEHKNLTAWETLVLFAVNFKKLNVHMNMGNVMGNVSWMTKDFRSDGRLSIGSTGHKNLYIAFGLGGSSLDAKGGIVGGNIEIANIDTYVHIREEPDVEPDHTIGLKLRALELRLDYMATSVLMCRVSDLNVNLKDEWKLNRPTVRESFMPTRRPASIFVHGVLSWDQLQLMISKSTTADLLKMFNKLEEFFSQQFNSSKRAFSGFSSNRPPRITPQKSRETPAPPTQPLDAPPSDARHHRHWQKVLGQVAGLQLNTMHVPLPSFGTVLGGTMELHGNNVSLACFHGINFKSKSWALFSLREPCINFNTESQEIPSTSDPSPAQDVHVVQTLICSLGLHSLRHLSMATVCKVTRTVIFPPQFKSLQEWFHYAFANSQIDEVDKFPSLEREKSEGSSSIERANRNTARLADPNHTREVIFALPGLQIHLKTEHLQNASVPDLNDDKPIVECSFITEFEDHIFVTVDAESFFFLHDLITSYLQEKERVLGGLERRGISEQDKLKPVSETPSKKASLEGDIFAKDWRNYNCKTWHLEPTVRLLSVAGKYIEPYGIDYILQKLGFSHARTTIPKWLQRGFMDPIDAILALLTLRVVQIVKGDQTNKEEKKALEIKK